MSGHHRCDRIPRDLCWLPSRSTGNILFESNVSAINVLCSIPELVSIVNLSQTGKALTVGMAGWMFLEGEAGIVISMS